MKRKYRLFLILYFYSIISISIFCPNCLAGVIINPDTIERVGRQKEQIKDVITITNNQEEPVDIKVTLDNWLRLKIGPEEWLKVEPDSFPLNPKESKDIIYTIDVPSEVEGELMAMVFFSVTSKDVGKSNIGMQIGIPVYIAVESTTTCKLEINYCVLRLEGKYLYGDILIKNDSNVHMRPKLRAILEGLSPEVYPEVLVPYGTAVRAGEAKYFSFMKEVSGDIPEQCKVTVIANYGVSGLLDNEITNVFGAVKIQKEGP